VDIPKRLRKEVEQLEAQHQAPEDKHEEEKRRRQIREAAEQENERFFRELARERRTTFLESVGYEGHGPGDLRDESFLYADDEPPFEITEDGKVFCTRDGKPVTTSHQVHAELYYWEFHDEGYNPRGLIHDEESQGYYMPEPPHELAFSRDRWYLPRFFWALGDDRADPHHLSVPERLGAS
jgi:hypothetical protein